MESGERNLAVRLRLEGRTESRRALRRGELPGRSQSRNGRLPQHCRSHDNMGMSTCSPRPPRSAPAEIRGGPEPPRSSDDRLDAITLPRGIMLSMTDMGTITAGPSDVSTSFAPPRRVRSCAALPSRRNATKADTNYRSNNFVRQRYEIILRFSIASDEFDCCGGGRDARARATGDGAVQTLGIRDRAPGSSDPILCGPARQRFVGYGDGNLPDGSTARARRSSNTASMAAFAIPTPSRVTTMA